MTPGRRLADLKLDAAYGKCTEIARRQAKNFYYAFLALPRPKRDAICAVYAFMRHADDISDDESRSRDERRADLAAFLDGWHSAAAGDPTDNPVFLALADTQTRFNIPLDLLDQLVQGTAMDLNPLPGGPSAGSEAADPRPYNNYVTFATFDDLRRYCYYVASVVGLVCIRIFGYTDARAESLAEDTGVAFQLTNILRDVREDAERGRIYLPLDDLDRYSVRIETLAALRDGSHMTLNQRELLESIANRAEDYYKSGLALLPLIDADARPALRVLVAIYHCLLRRIERRGFDVFSERVRVPLATRLAILFRGLLQVLRDRLFGRPEVHA
ncbi:MAG TPA: phytoene/squalene synthase family protein [Acidobacteriaceae bacterium]|nr:phytoene/squalene synthase family protein [Acidobacteriaceae bacterium]